MTKQMDNRVKENTTGQTNFNSGEDKGKGLIPL